MKIYYLDLFFSKCVESTPVDVPLWSDFPQYFQLSTKYKQYVFSIPSLNSFIKIWLLLFEDINMNHFIIISSRFKFHRSLTQGRVILLKRFPDSLQYYFSFKSWCFPSKHKLFFQFPVISVLEILFSYDLFFHHTSGSHFHGHYGDLDFQQFNTHSIMPILCVPYSNQLFFFNLFVFNFQVP